MKSLVTDIRLQFNENHQPELVLALSLPPQQAQEGVQDVKDLLANDKPVQVEIKQHRKLRSLDANAYLWVLLQKIAEVIGSTKEEVYREFIREVGQFEIVPIKNEAVERWINNWKAKGLGWHAEVLSESKIQGYTNIISYYGSSVYNTKEMSVLLDEVVSECRNLGIETMTPEELASLKENWEKGEKKT